MSELKWGETPWDNLSREKLLREVQRMYSALISMNSCLRVIRCGDAESSYWSTHGAGGAALEKARQIMEPLNEKYGSEKIFRSFFRYADDLLFQRATHGRMIGFGWRRCPKCGVCWGETQDGDSHNGKRCGDVGGGVTNCDGILRPIAWEDLQASEEKP